MENRSFRITCSRTNQKPYTGQKTEIAHYVRTYLWVTMLKFLSMFIDHSYNEYIINYIVFFYVEKQVKVEFH